MPIQVVDLVVGTGDEAVEEKILTVNYTSFIQGSGGQPNQLIAGQTLPGELIDVPVDGHMLISGWNQGVKSMRVGGKRRITIPPDLAYEDVGLGDIVPEDATLIFEVELFAVKDPP